MDCERFVLNIKFIDILNGLKNLKDVFDFSKLEKDHEKFSNENKKIVRKFKIETP